MRRGDAAIVGVAERLDAQERRSRLVRRDALATGRKQHVPADHQPGKLLLAGRARLAAGHHLALPHDVHGVGDCHDLPQFVRDQEDGDPVALQGPEDVEQTVGLLRGQHAGRLVQDQDARAAQQGLEDFDPLLQADRQPANRRVRVNLQAVGGAQLRHPRAGGLRTTGQPGAPLASQHDVFEYGHGRHQHEVLVHHADAMGDGLRGPAQTDRLAVDQDLAAVGGVEAVEDGDEGGLAGAVLTDDPGDGAVLDGKADIAVGVDGAETLVDPAQLHRRGGTARTP